MLSARMPMVMTYRRFRAACSSYRLGWASVMSTGSVLRGRADSWLEATTPFPPPTRRGMESSADGMRLRRPSCHPIPADAGAAQRLLASCSGAARGRLRGLLLLLLELAHLGQRLRAGDVGDRPPRPLLAVGARGRTPARRGDAVLLAEPRHEDLRLLGAEAGELADPLQQGGAVRDVVPQPVGAAAVAGDEQP